MGGHLLDPGQPNRTALKKNDSLFSRVSQLSIAPQLGKESHKQPFHPSGMLMACSHIGLMQVITTGMGC